MMMGKSHFLLNVEISKTNGDKRRRHIYAKKNRKHKHMRFEATMVPSCYNCIAVSKCSHLRPKGGLSPLLQKNIVGPHLYPPTKTCFFQRKKHPQNVLQNWDEISFED